MRADLSHEVPAQSFGGDVAVLDLRGALLFDPSEPRLGVRALRNEVVEDVAPPTGALGLAIVGVLRLARRLLFE